jgi:hypothetical protein
MLRWDGVYETVSRCGALSEVSWTTTALIEDAADPPLRTRALRLTVRAVEEGIWSRGVGGRGSHRAWSSKKQSS